MWCGNTKINHRNGQAKPCLVRSPGTDSDSFGHFRRAASREGSGPLCGLLSSSSEGPQSSVCPPPVPQPPRRGGRWRTIGCWREILHPQDWHRPTDFTATALTTQPRHGRVHLAPFQAQQRWRNHFCRTGRLKKVSETGLRQLSLTEP